MTLSSSPSSFSSPLSFLSCLSDVDGAFRCVRDSKHSLATLSLMPRWSLCLVGLSWLMLVVLVGWCSVLRANSGLEQQLPHMLLLSPVASKAVADDNSDTELPVLPTLHPSSFHCDAHRFCKQVLRSLYTSDPFALDNPTILFPPAPLASINDSIDMYANLTYPYHLYPEAEQVAAAASAATTAAYTKQDAVARLLEMCNGNTTEAVQWEERAAVMRKSLAEAPADTPVAVFVDGRNITEVSKLRQILLLFEITVHVLPAAYRIHLWLLSDVVSGLARLSPFMYSYMHLSRKFILHPLPADVQFDRRVYQHFILQPPLWHALQPATHIILFESDSGFCEAPTFDLRHFLMWDYCGAPWYTKWCNDSKDASKTTCVGNSGLSLWRRAAMASLGVESPFNTTNNLDLLLNAKVSHMFPRFKVCPAPIGRLFSVETHWDGKYVPFGYHNIRPQHINAAFNTICPNRARLQAANPPLSAAHTPIPDLTNDTLDEQSEGRR